MQERSLVESDQGTLQAMVGVLTRQAKDASTVTFLPTPTAFSQSGNEARDFFM